MEPKRITAEARTPLKMAKHVLRFTLSEGENYA